MCLLLVDSEQIPFSFSPEVIAEERTCIEVRGQLSGKSLTWVYPVVGFGEAPRGHEVLALSCAAKASVRKDFEASPNRPAAAGQGHNGGDAVGNFGVLLALHDNLKDDYAQSLSPVNV